MTPRRSLGAAAAVVVAVAAILLGFAGVAQAHSVLLSTTPAQTTTVAGSPEQVTLTFNEMPRQRYTTVHVVGPDGVRRDSGSARVVDDNVDQALGGTRPAGIYTVDWRVISSDGHPVSGQFTYTATAAASALAAVVTPPPATDDSSSGGTSVVLIVVIVVVVIVVLAAGVVLTRRRRAVPVRVGHDEDDDS